MAGIIEDWKIDSKHIYDDDDDDDDETIMMQKHHNLGLQALNTGLNKKWRVS